MSKNYKYIVDVVAKTQGFVNNMKGVTNQVNATSRMVRGLAGAMAAAFSVSMIKNFASESFELYKRQEQAEQRLRAAMKANGNESEIAFRKYQRFASGLQRVTTIGDETTLELLQLAESMQASDPKQAVEGAIGLSKALGMDLTSAVKAATMAQEGQYTMLSRYIPGLRTATTEAERLAAVQEVMASGMAIAKAETETTAGKIDQLKNSWGDLKEKVGGAILSSESLRKDLDSWGKLIDVWQADNISKWQKFWSSVSKSAMNANFDKVLQQQEAAEVVDMYDEMYSRARSAADEAREANDRLQNRITPLQALQQKGVITYGEINERIKEYNDLLSITDVSNTRQIASILREVEALQNKKKALDDLIKPQQKTERVDNMDGMSGLATGLVTYSGEGSEALADMQSFINGNIDKVRELQFVWMDFANQYGQILQGMYEGYEDITQVHMVAGDFIDQMMSSAKMGVDSFEDFSKAIGDAARKSINAFVAEGVAGAVSTALAKSGIPFPLNMVAAAVAAAGATSLLNSAIPKFADGGIVSGPTIGMMGEYPGARSNPEVIAPLNKLKDMISSPGGSTVVVPDGIDIDGYKLRILLKKVEKSVNYRS